MNITVWFDYTCPFCYIGKVRLEKAVRQSGKDDVQIEMKAFQLNPAAGKYGRRKIREHFMGKYGITGEEADRRIRTIGELADAEGLEMHYAEARTANTLSAHRLTKLAAEQGTFQIARNLADQLFKAYFCENADIGDKALLQLIGEKAGLPTDTVRNVLETDTYWDAVMLDQMQASQKGIRKVPHFEIGDLEVSGIISTERLYDLLCTSTEGSGSISGEACSL